MMNRNLRSIHGRSSQFGRITGKNRPWYEVQAQDGAEIAEVLIYDEISWWGIQAEQFVKDLSAITAPTIKLRVNSPGGYVFDGVAIYNALKNHSSRVETHIEGLAASMASIIALAGDKVFMAKNAFFMIHDPWAMAVGNAADMRKEADVLDKIAASMADTYKDRSVKSLKEVKQLMADETWFNATEAKAVGFVDEIISDQKVEEEKALAQVFDLSVFRNAPAALLAGRREGQPPTERELEAILRDAGYSRRVALAAVATVRAEGGLRDAGSNGLESVLQGLVATIRK